MYKDELIGCWSADAMYGPGAQSDDVIVFKEDATGFLEVSNPTPCFAEFFHWDIEQDNSLRLSGDKVLVLNEDSTQVEELISDLNIVATVAVKSEQTKAGRVMRVLRFESRPWAGISDHFGFCGRDIGNCDPDFSFSIKPTNKSY